MAKLMHFLFCVAHVIYFASLSNGQNNVVTANETNQSGPIYPSMTDQAFDLNDDDIISNITDSETDTSTILPVTPYYPFQLSVENKLLNGGISTAIGPNFDFNLDDLEDLVNTNESELDDGVQMKSNLTSFEGLSLNQEELKNEIKAKNVIPLLDKIETNRNESNILKILRNKSDNGEDFIGKTNKINQPFETIKYMSAINISAVNERRNFQFITHLFDQSHWSINAINKSHLTNDCFRDINIYLEAINKEEMWALKASDSSGRYRGQYFFGNDFWLGSILFCNDIYYDEDKHNSDIRNISKNHVELGFYVAKILISISSFKQEKFLYVAQCLPKSCSTSDVKSVMELDPSAVELSTNTDLQNASNKSNIVKFVDVRRVPGDYQLWNDKRFLFILPIICCILLLAVIATIYESQRTKLLKVNIKLQYTNALSNPTSYNNSVNLINSITNGKLNGIDSSNELHQIAIVNNNVDIQTKMESKFGINKPQNYYQTNNGEIKSVLNAKSENTDDEEHLSISQKLLISFDFVSNFKAIMSTKPLPEESVSCIHGMRVFSMLWTIMVHSYLQAFAIAENKFGRIIAERSFWYQIIGSAGLSVDTFFFLSGLLVTLLFLRNLAPKNTNVRGSIIISIKKIFHLTCYRYLRLTPALIFVLAYTELAMKTTYNNTPFPSVLADHLTCPQYWWRNILYIQNWFPFPQLCMIWSWYLANDMQFYIWAVILLSVSQRYFKTAAYIIFSFLISSWIITALVSLHHNYEFRISDPLASFGFIYDQAYTRIGPYIMGMITGYIIYRCKQPPNVSLSLNLLFWLISIVISFLLVFGIWNGKLSVPMTAVYVSLSHSAWGLSLIWVTLSCKWGLAKHVNNLLSCRVMLPLSRLTYCTYLIHPVTQVVTSFQMQGPLHIAHFMVLTIFLGNAVVSYFFAFIISITLEAPVVRILRLIYHK